MKKCVVVSDIHVPYNCQKATKAFLSFLKDFKADVLVLNGDIADMKAASGHSDSEGLVKDEIEAVNAFLDEVQAAAGRQCSIHYCQGNHEQFYDRYVAKNAAALKGLSSLPRELELKRRGITWSEYGKVHFLSKKLGVTHGAYHGTNYARETLIKFGMSLIVGHAHRPQVHTMGVAGESASQVRGCFGLGCLVPVDNVSYIKGPPGWTQGWGVFYVLPDGTFTPYPIMLTNQKFVWNGKLYGV